MKFFLVNNFYFPWQRGGAEEIVRVTARALRSLGHEVIIVTGCPIDKKNFKKNKDVVYLPSFYFWINKQFKLIRFFWHFVEYFNIIKAVSFFKILKKEKPDIVISHNLKGLFLPLPLVTHFLKIKHIHILHDIQLLHPSGLMLYKKETILDFFPAIIYQKINRFIFKETSLIISPSQWLLDIHTNKKFFLYAKRLHLPNPLSIDSAFLTKAEGKKTDNKFKFIFAGQIELHKGIFLLIDAVLALAKNREMEVSIFGSGSLASDIKKLSKKFENLNYFGHITRKELQRNLMASDCLIFPSLCYENFPGIVCEAAFWGVPTIMPRLAGAGELLENIGGIDFLPANPISLAEKMLWAIKNPQKTKKIGLLAQERIKYLTTNDYLQKYVGCFWEY